MKYAPEADDSCYIQFVSDNHFKQIFLVGSKWTGNGTFSYLYSVFILISANLA